MADAPQNDTTTENPDELPEAATAVTAPELDAGGPETGPDDTPVETAEADEEAEETEEVAAAAPSAPGTMLLFQPPETVVLPARRQAEEPPPDDEDVHDVDDVDDVDDDEDERDTSDATGDDGDDGEDGGEGGGNRRRRRRGGRRRRKSGGSGGDSDSGDSGDQGDAAKTDEKTVEKSVGKSGGKSDDQDGDQDGDDQGSDGQGGSSRRRRRRRREGEGGGANEDPNTVTKVRKGRSAEDEITAVTGSTRLEAKKQRRREGREAGRRRAPIVSEAEFLARRESVERVMVIRQRNDLTQIGVLEDKVLVEHYVARESQTSLIGNVYLGRVQNVLPSMEAAFIDIGKGRNAVLYAGEVNWSALGHKDGTPRKIESVLQSGQTVLVQVTKDPVGHKGARLTSQISLAGRFLVYVPDGNTSGISRKLPDTERSRLKKVLKEIVPESAGVIVRTAAEGAAEDELTRDVERLKARWEDIEKKSKGSAPQLLYGEPDLTLKVVRDLFTEDFTKLVIQGDDAWETVRSYVEHVAPDLADRLEHHQPDDGAPDVFATYRLDEQIAKGLDRKVWLPSGGSLIIDRTEAMTVIDVNTGKFTGSGGNLEETVTKNNLEAAEEIVRQLRLRDIGGIIVVDFIDMVLESNRDLVLRRLVECLGRDRTRHQVAEVTSLGLVQMTRKRIGTGLLEAFSESCEHCQGRGLTVHDLPVEPKRGGGSSGDDVGRRGGRKRRGKGSGQGGSPKAPVPSPKEVAAMAETHGPVEDDADPTSSDAEPQAEPDATESDATEPDATESDATEPDTAAQDEAAPDEAAQDEAASSSRSTRRRSPKQKPVKDEPAHDAAPTTPDQPEERAPAASEPVQPETPAAAPPEPPATTVVTRTRRRSASRPAGPPPGAEDAGDPAQLALIGDIGAPPEHGVVEPNVASIEPGAEASDDEAAASEETPVEHVPVKKKGSRKR